MFEEKIELANETHIFKTELDNIKPWSVWIQENKTTEEFNKWVSLKNTPTDEFSTWYNEWLVDQKITHTIIKDGTETVNSHTEV